MWRGNKGGYQKGKRHDGERIFAQLTIDSFSAGSMVQWKQPYHRGGRCAYKRAATFEPSSSSSLLEDSKGDSYVVPSRILYILGMDAVGGFLKIESDTEDTHRLSGERGN